MSSTLSVSATLSSSGLAPLEAKLLLGHILGRDRAWLAAHADASIDGEQHRRFDALMRRRHAGEPIAYLLGRREFYGLDLEVTPDVLIPRPETELLVDFALEKIHRDAPAQVLDLGTGSGAMALAIAQRRPMAQIIAVDASTAALVVARRNAQRLGIDNVQWMESDWFSKVPHETFAVIVANPPYISSNDPHLNEGDIRFEPRSALTPGFDGLAAIRTIVGEAPAHLLAGGCIAIEHGFDHADAVQALLRAAGFTAIAARRDLAGILRTTFATWG
jgi:release factor glutamine methyltransferase